MDTVIPSIRFHSRFAPGATYLARLGEVTSTGTGAILTAAAATEDESRVGIVGILEGKTLFVVCR